MPTLLASASISAAGRTDAASAPSDGLAQATRSRCRLVRRRDRRTRQPDRADPRHARCRRSSAAVGDEPARCRRRRTSTSATRRRRRRLSGSSPGVDGDARSAVGAHGSIPRAARRLAYSGTAVARSVLRAIGVILLVAAAAIPGGGVAATSSRSTTSRSATRELPLLAGSQRSASSSSRSARGTRARRSDVQPRALPERRGGRPRRPTRRSGSAAAPSPTECLRFPFSEPASGKCSSTERMPT